MYVKVMLWIKRNNYCSIVVNSTTQSVSCLLCTHDMTEFDKNFAMRVTYDSSAWQHLSLHLYNLAAIWSGYFNAYYIAVGFKLLNQVLLYSFNLFTVE